MTARLSVEGVSCGYTNVPVLRDVSLSLAPGEVVGVLGANGAGKTTLLRTISGAVRVRSGRVVLEGVDITRAQPWTRVRAGLAHVPEGRHVFPEMSVRDNLRVAGLAAGARAPALDEILDLFPNLVAHLGQAAGTLSGGEQQMLAIGRALMTRPGVLVVDEMSAGLAPVITQDVVAALGEIRTLDVGIVVVEQSPQYVADLVDRVYLLERGSIVGEGTLDSLGGVDRLADLYLGVG